MPHRPNAASARADTRPSVLRQWYDELDLAECRALNTVGMWLGTTALMAGLVALGSLVPGARDFFGLTFWDTIIWFSPALAAGLFLVARLRSETISKLEARWLDYTSTVWGFVFLAAFLAKTTILGSIVPATLLLLAASYHGYNERASLKRPMIPIGIVFALSVTHFLISTADRGFVFAATAVTAVAMSLLAGTHARNTAALRRHSIRNEALKAAIEAQRLAATYDPQLEEAIEFRGLRHDLANRLQTALVAAERLEDIGGPKAPHLVRLMAALRESRDLVRTVGREPRARGKRAEPVDVVQTVRDAVKRTAGEFTAVEVDLSVESPSIGAPIHGGTLTLSRVLENLLRNACEGDGSAHASHVHVAVGVDEFESTVTITIDDDGPGYPSTIETGKVEPFQTTKADGTGIGLFTAQRLLGGTGGTLALSESPGGGARARVFLPATLFATAEFGAPHRSSVSRGRPAPPDREVAQP